jgi:hypothetical protein
MACFPVRPGPDAGTPGWHVNLRADPRAEVGYRGRTVPVVAREADGDEREAV